MDTIDARDLKPGDLFRFANWPFAYVVLVQHPPSVDDDGVERHADGRLEYSRVTQPPDGLPSIQRYGRHLQRVRSVQ